MAEACENCNCGLGDEDCDHQRAIFGGLNLPVQQEIREAVTDRLDMGEDDVFIKQVTICPEKTEVTFEDRT